MANFLKQKPRVDIRTQDNTPGKFPTIARTGTPNRLGNNSKYFDDRNSIVFTPSGSTVTISYPTTIPVSSSYLSSTLQTNISAAGRTVKAIDQWLTLPTQLENIGPFKETKLFEQDIKSTTFYQTGSDVSLVGDGFSANLGAKTQIRITVPVTAITRFMSSSACLYYLNWDLGKFEEIGSAYRHRTVPNLGFWETRLFSPLGSTIVSSSNGAILNLVGDSAGAQFGPSETSSRAVSYVSTMLGQTLQTTSTQSALVDTRFAATSSQYLPMSRFLTQPFALEKMTIEFPFISGQGWHGDLTNFVRMGGVSGSGAYRGDPFDSGGPCVTMGLLNQIDGGSRDLILSATIIPSSDNISGTTVSPLYNERFAAGFISFSTPAAVVTPNSSNQFTGTIRLNVEPQISNGVTSLGFGTPPSGYPVNNGRSFRNSFSIAINPFGRGMKGKQSGRSLFGKEYVMPTDDPPSTLASRFASGSYNDVYLFNYEKGITSPYILLPNDKLILAFAKYRGCATGSALSSWNYTSNLDVNIHDVGINVGSVEITLYGSLIKNAKEYHDPLNSILDTNSVNESIGSEAITDQFDVNYEETLSGSYTSLIMSGSIFSTGSWISTGVGTATQRITEPGRARGVWLDATKIDVSAKHNDSPYFSVREKYLWSMNQVQRNTQLVSTEERFYDSMLPRIDEIMLRNNAAPQENTVAGYKYYLSFDMKTGAGDDTEWSKSYPFAPEYNGLARNTSVDKILPFRSGYTTPTDSYAQFPDRGAIFYSDLRASNGTNGYNTHFEWFADTNSLANPAGLNYEDLIKLIYGIGDKNNCRYANGGQDHEVSGSLYGSTCNPQGRTKYIYAGVLDLYFGAEIRGWKYGLLNGLPFKTKTMWRSNHFGQFRDMLEQRLDSKFYDGSSILTSPVQVKFISKGNTQVIPEKTWSSNLSFEATSSLPYFDGQVRNRENPLNLNSLYNFRFIE